MQILVVVASTKIKIFWAEVEKGLTWTEIVRELVDPKEFVKHNLKGQRIIKKKVFFVKKKNQKKNLNPPFSERE